MVLGKSVYLDTRKNVRSNQKSFCLFITNEKLNRGKVSPLLSVVKDLVTAEVSLRYLLTSWLCSSSARCPWPLWLLKGFRVEENSQWQMRIKSGIERVRPMTRQTASKGPERADWCDSKCCTSLQKRPKAKPREVHLGQTHFSLWEDHKVSSLGARFWAHK